MLKFKSWVSAVNRADLKCPIKVPCLVILGKETEVLEALKSARVKGGNFSAYTHDEMLERWHYKHCARTPPILLTADLGFLFSTDKHNTS